MTTRTARSASYSVTNKKPTARECVPNATSILGFWPGGRVGRDLERQLALGPGIRREATITPRLAVHDDRLGRVRDLQPVRDQHGIDERAGRDRLLRGAMIGRWCVRELEGVATGSRRLRMRDRRDQQQHQQRLHTATIPDRGTGSVNGAAGIPRDGRSQRAEVDPLAAQRRDREQVDLGHVVRGRAVQRPTPLRLTE